MSLLTLTNHAHSGDYTSQVIKIGIKVFPMIVGGNLDLRNRIGPTGEMLLAIVYTHNKLIALKTKKRLGSSIGNIDKYRPVVKIVQLDKLLSGNYDVAGIFIAEKLSKESLRKLTKFGILNKSVVFSPFENDVRNGVFSGLHIATSITPSINLATVKATSIRFNRLFLRVAKAYD